MKSDLLHLIDELDGRLNETERRTLTERLRNEPEMRALRDELIQLRAGIGYRSRRAELDRYRRWDAEAEELEKGIALSARTQMLRQLREWDEPTETVAPQPELHPVRRRRWRAWAVAASLLLLVGMGWWLWETQRTTPHAALVAAYFEALPMIGITRSSDTEALEQLRSEANQYYTGGAYDQAIPALERAVSEYRDSLSVFYLGVSQLGNDQAAAAIQSLERFRTYRAAYPDLQNQAQWYLALAHLQNDDPQAALILLKQLNTTDPRPKYEELIERIETQ